MNPTRDKFIVEKFGECWHEAKIKGELQSFACTCGFRHCDKKNINLSTSDGFFWLWGKMREDESVWYKFWLRMSDSVMDEAIYKLIDNPSRFADAISKFLPTIGKSYEEFLKGKEKG